MSVITNVFDVFANVATWIVETIPDITGLFYNAEQGLTVLGTLGVTSLGMSVAFLLLGFILKFFRFSAN